MNNNINAYNISDPSAVMHWILLILVLLVAIVSIVAKRWFKLKFINKLGYKSLQNRTVSTFILIAAIPTITIAVFSTYFFNYGMQSWFDSKISTVLDQSIIVAESYIKDSTNRLKETAISLADDLDQMYYDLVNDKELFNQTLGAEAEMRSIDDVIIFQKSTNTIMAKTSLSFSLTFTTLPSHFFDATDHGEVVIIDSDPTKIKALIKLKEYDDTYMLIGKLIDEKITNHVNKTNGAALDYYTLKNKIFGMQVQFFMVFIFVALLLIIISISFGLFMTRDIVEPINALVLATNQIKEGDFTISVTDHNNIEELSILASAFNKMVKQIDHQQKDLVIAQRALAWSDVARKVAHEINNPLTPIQLAAEMLRDKFYKDSTNTILFKKYIDIILNNSNDIQTILSEFVNFARLPKPVFEKCDIVEILQNTIDSRRVVYEHINYSLNIVNTSYEIACDKMQINQMLVNLIKNSEESLNGTINPKIDISLEINDDLLHITISDNGPGFPEANLTQVTEAYFTTRAKGMGLGLAIVKKIVQEHSGYLTIDNLRQGGANVKLTFNISMLRNFIK